ncbi:MAG: hypothetical protein IPO17_14060 [Flavobacteriales bacterium]|nr:hypothetical protein [Flavobacteriales bacterium]
MDPAEKAKRKARLKRFGHFFSGLLIVLHAYERYEHGHATWSLFAAAGILFLLVAAFHTQLVRKWPWVDGTFFAIEAALSLTVMGEFILAGKKGLPFMYLLAALFQVFAAVMAVRKGGRAAGH